LDYRDYVVCSAGAQRPKDIARLVGDSTKAKTSLGWSHTVSFEELVCMMVDADVQALASTETDSHKHTDREKLL
jgi:GDPmannose 4,6-dehydratase